jgi:anthranilate phosphoribosyltransferase
MSLTKEILDLLAPNWGEGDPTAEEGWAREAMKTLMAAAADSENHVSIAAFLAALQVRGPRGSHLAGFASALRSMGRKIDFNEPNLVDTCGTGGGIPSLNISTGAALLAAAAGAKVAKHGNRGVTSACGSADILEALGITITPEESKLQRCMREANFAFLFAPHFYQPMGWVRPVRIKMGIRTVFNQLGPLLNPAGAKRQIIGVFHGSQITPTAEALLALGAEIAWVAHGLDGMDEISPLGPSLVARVRQGDPISPETWNLSEASLDPADPLAAAPSGTSAESADRILRGLTDPDSPEFAVLAPTAAAAIHLGLGLDLPQAADLARSTAASGKARDTIRILVEATGP